MYTKKQHLTKYAAIKILHAAQSTMREFFSCKAAFMASIHERSHGHVRTKTREKLWEYARMLSKKGPKRRKASSELRNATILTTLSTDMSRTLSCLHQREVSAMITHTQMHIHTHGSRESHWFPPTFRTHSSLYIKYSCTTHVVHHNDRLISVSVYAQLIASRTQCIPHTLWL